MKLNIPECDRDRPIRGGGVDSAHDDVWLWDVIGLIPVMWATGTGADVMKGIAAPQVGGVFSAILLTLFLIPPVYVTWRCWKERKIIEAVLD